MSTSTVNSIIELIATVGILFLAIILHECAHGWTANKLGDPTAKLAGRLTLNPLKHIDPFGSIILPGILLLISHLGYNTVVLGWAKPVPVNFYRLKHPRRDMMLVALAGPITNILLAAAFSQFLRFDLSLQIFNVVVFGVFINILLAVFNMIPIPPLDGSRIVLGLLPTKLARAYGQLERYGILIIFALLYLGVLHTIVAPILHFMGNMFGVNLE